MDIVRQPVNRKRRRLIYGGAALAGIAAVTAGLTALDPAAPTVERGSAWIDTVEAGPLVLQVRGPGTLVPEQTRWVTAVTAGRVERRLVEPGQTVTPETVLLVLSNPDVQLEALESERQLTAAQAERMNLQVQLESQRLNQEAIVAEARSAFEEARRNARAADSLVAAEMIPRMEAERLRGQLAETETRFRTEEGRLKLYSQVIDSQVDMQRAQVTRMRAVHEFQRDRVRSMEVTAGAHGVVQELPLEVGQWAQSGATLARVVQPGRLKAVLRIPETPARDVVLGQTAAIDTRNGIIPGRVSRIDPASVSGTVTVDVALTGELPRGARPDLTVDGTIEVDRVDSTLSISRPAYGQGNSSTDLFRLTPDGKYAERVTVRLGRSSVNAVEILGGLQAGDRVIISDMSRYGDVNRVRLD
ncbi:MAG TPA: HlyD family efflux transporter periplasmic adaptor subunit [Gemmatimonadales bacterium]